MKRGDSSAFFLEMNLNCIVYHTADCHILTADYLSPASDYIYWTLIYILFSVVLRIT